MGITHSEFFLTEEEICALTGRKVKSLQIEQLRRMLIPFHVNALGRPVVTRASLISRPQNEPAAAKGWSSRVITGG